MVRCFATHGGIRSEAGCEENLDAWPTLGCTVDKVDAVHAGHHHVGDHQVYGALPLFADGECLISIRGVQDAVAHRCSILSILFRIKSSSSTTRIVAAKPLFFIRRETSAIAGRAGSKMNGLVFICTLSSVGIGGN